VQVIVVSALCMSARLSASGCKGLYVGFVL
jgi:hypothetical protein